ncbi:HlyIII protein [Rhizoctonia solani]|uniref:HlyIII protein n=1 Tax=Rhizoctonia solani TaxID=456999 RepID=A0A8H7I388_9AGAM|nr:HlyIII protein [Rhizoctonia solani]
MASATKSAGTTTKVATTVAAASVAVIAAQPLLLKFDDGCRIQDNAFILSGYRRPQYSWSGCARSVFGYLHNESVNIHTHLFGALWLLYILVNVGKTQAGYTTLTWHDPVGFGLGLLAGVFCLGASALYHTSTCHSPAVGENALIYRTWVEQGPKVSRRCNALDYSGIIGEGVFAINISTRKINQSVVSHDLCSGHHCGRRNCSIRSAQPGYGTPAYRWARTTVFFLLGICALVPVTHAYLIYGLERMQNEMGINWIALTGIMYMSGALIYACRVPERWFPGTFDFFGSSHQIFHVCVVIAALSHYQAVLTGFEYWHGQHHGVCPT